MAFKFDLQNKVVEFLKQDPEKRYTAREIAEGILKNHPKDCLKKKEDSEVKRDERAFLSQLAAEINSGRRKLFDLKIETIEGVGHRQFYYTELSDSEEIRHAEDSASASPVTNAKSIAEFDLYPILTEFLWSEFKIYSKRINDKHSSNSQGPSGNKWLFPDLVGMDNLSQDWEREIKDCAREYGDKKSKLWSFEVKNCIKRSDVRASFFQAVINSSWANFGYLVAKEIKSPDKGPDDTRKELEMLSNLHGIGFILLDDENPSESKIIIHAKERNEIDWNTANRLTKENSNFRKYIETIRQFYQTGKIYSEDWDTVSQED